MCGKQRSYKSFVFVSAANKEVTGKFLISAVNKGVSGNMQLGKRRGGVAGAVGRERVCKLLKRRE
jgi:hypothetical protein